MRKLWIISSLIIVSFSILSCGGESTVIYNAPTIQDTEDLAKLRAREKEELTSYKIIEAEKGVYQIPVDSAMAIMAGDKADK
ncbi:MAG: hypothetical protein KAR42_00345 [candidate division Zixibacteria bacterium]|nr:hypothetical protein [candidate division Zixibacteria bacterium]